MDYMKKATIKKYSHWDLTCPRIVHIRNRQKIETMFKRSARRILRENLKKELDSLIQI